MQTDRQKEIVDAALELISKKGIQGLTIKNLSKMIGVTEPAIYRHFENKMEILVAILDLFKYNTEQIFEKELKSEGSAIEKIEHLFNRHFTSFSSTPSLVSVIFAEEIFRGEPLLVGKISEVIGRNDVIVTSILIEGQRSGEIRDDIDAKDLSTMVLGSLRLFVKKWQFSGYSFSITVEGKSFVKSIKTLIEKQK